MGVEPRILNAANESEIDTAFATLAKEHSVPIVVSANALFTDRPARLIALAARYAIPAIYPYREFAAAGGLISYGSDIGEGYRRVGIYAGKILKGAKPADLPVQQVVKVELVINLNTAKTLGLTIPVTLLSRADGGDRIAGRCRLLAQLGRKSFVDLGPLSYRLRTRCD